MKLIAPLCSGMNGAGGGTASILRRGTGTYATYYTTFEGTNADNSSSAVTPTAPVTLDGNGRLLAFVNEYVDVVVKDSSGNTLVTFGAGEAATAVEVRSPSFIGTDYNTSVAAASKPISLEAVLDKLIVSFGTTDWNVLVNGASKTLQAAIAGASGIFFNVKDATYGAVGDGIADDTAAIQSAFTAASALGGIVFFPPSTLYRITATINVGSNVSVLGVGGPDTAAGGTGGSTISVDHATANGLTFASSSTVLQTITGICIRPKQANTGAMIKITNAARLRLDSVYLGSSLTTTGNCILCNTTDGAKLTALGCRFEVGGSAAHVLMTLGYAEIYSSTFVMPTGAYSANSFDGVKGLVSVGNYFENSTITSGTFTNVRGTGAGKQTVVVGNYFPNPTGGTGTAWSAAADQLQESGNFLGSLMAVSAPNATGAQAARNGYQFSSRQTRCSYIADNSASLSVDPSSYGYIRVVRSTATDQTLDVTQVTTPGQTCLLVVENASVGNIANEGYSGTGTTGALNAPILAGNVQVFPLIAVEYNSKVRWTIATGSLPTPFAR